MNTDDTNDFILQGIEIERLTDQVDELRLECDRLRSELDEAKGVIR
jgi:hypothetical protein